MKLPGSMKFLRSQSLRRRLTWRLVLLQTITLSVAATLLTMALLQLDPSQRLIDSTLSEVIAQAMQRAPDGSLVLGPSKQLDAYRAEGPGVWMLVVDDAGNSYREGPVPEQYELLLPILNKLWFIDIRDHGEPHTLSAAFYTGETSIGKLHVLAGGGAFVSLVFAGILLGNIFILPLLVVLIIATVIAIPLIVRKVMRGLDSAEAQARSINFNQHGTRLPLDTVPREVRGLVTAMNEALSRLDEGYERHRRFLADAAHELKTPIAILQTRVENLDPGPERTRLLTDTARLAAMAEQLLDLQRLSQSGADFQPVDLVPLAERVVADHAPLAISAGYDISLRAPELQQWVLGDRGAIERLLTNLVQNAVVHGGNEGTIEIEMAGHGAFEVHDSGPGIAPEHRERVFEPFYRIRPLDRGAGLGLNLVREVVRQHGGSIAVLPSHLGGVCFRVQLPMAKTAA
jgi:signal transduction histidine kinase